MAEFTISSDEAIRELGRALPKRDQHYDAQKDFAGSLIVGYAAIRERMKAGGKGWEPK